MFLKVPAVPVHMNKNLIEEVEILDLQKPLEGRGAFLATLFYVSGRKREVEFFSAELRGGFLDAIIE